MAKEVSLGRIARQRPSRIAWALLLISLALTAGAWQFSILLVEDRTQARFETQSLQLKTAIEERLLNYEQVLAGSAGLFAVADLVGREDWRLYVNKLDINRYYPGIQGLGFTARVEGDEVRDFVRRIRDQGLPDYLINPAGVRAEYHPIVFLEPSTQRNKRAYGYDAFGDPTHRQAMEEARDSGLATMTGKVVLVQEEVDDKQAGFLMYFPVYDGDKVPRLLEDRRDRLRGFVFSAFRMNNLMDGIVGLIAPFLDVRIYDSDVAVKEALMYGSNLGSLDNDYTFAMSQKVEHGGRTWLLQTHTTPAFDYLASDPRPLIVLVAGIIISLLLFAFSLVMIRSRLLAQINAGRYRAITEGASNITLILDQRGQTQYVSPSSEYILGYDPRNVPDLSLERQVHPDDWPQMQQVFEQAMEEPGKALPVVHARIRDACGDWRDMEGSYTAMMDVPGVNGVVVSLRDLTELKAAQTELHRLAFYDPLTGLANRQLFRDRLEHVIRRCKRSGQSAALMFLDLDGFKRINDTLGHDVGDQLLQSVAGWLIDCVREEDSVARLGGDEFVVLLSEVTGSDAAAGVAESILRRLCQRIRLGEHEVRVTVSIGLAMIPDDSADATSLMKYADLAMYRAKELGRNNVQFFTAAMNIQAARRMLQQEELSNALDGDRFVLHFQPKFDLAREQVLGVEAFLRWQHPERGLVPAQQFIHLAEESGLIVRLGELALRQACIQIQALERAGFGDLRISVNLSARQVIDPGFMGMFRQVITETGVRPEQLEVELPSELLNEDPDILHPLLRALHDIGVCLILDNFGAGSCSLAAMQRLPLNAVKIDQVFIRDIPYNATATDVTSAVIALAHKLHLTVIAEGVETPQQLNFLRASGCAQAQGNLFSYPLDEDALIGFLVRQQERSGT
ncbi:MULTISPECIES: EAL domain-containing protein [Marinobacter]|uniref:bifunctional diguanylate cyclase/phosphodiesterase n=1 Tax=Marinobacter TaxID=2742 RepID=UPI000DAC3233|nr:MULTISPECIES: EAL domain-containing protein [Marinobacter]